MSSKMNLQLLLNLHNVRRNMWLKPQELEQIQVKKLRELLRYAYENVPFYHAKFRNAGVRPDSVQTIKDMTKIPLTTKSEIQSTPLDQVVARNIDISKCAISKTSGSTGMPLRTLAGKRTMAFGGALWLRAFFENGLRLGDRRIIISDPRSHDFGDRGWTQRLGIMRRKYASIFEEELKKYSLISREKPDVIEGYPSSLAILADFCRTNNDKLKSRLVFTQGEFLDENSRRLIGSTFDAELFDYYGSSEFNLIAWECKAHSGYHLNSDGLVVEFLSDGEHVNAGERGEIVCSTLMNREMPLIRYDVGDVGIPAEERCKCGIVLPLIEVVEGRRDDLLLSMDGRIISPTVFFPYPFGTNAQRIRHFRVIQERKDKLLIQLVVGDDFGDQVQIFKTATNELHRLFGEGMHIEFQIVADIKPDENAKLRRVISKVPVKISN